MSDGPRGEGVVVAYERDGAAIPQAGAKPRGLAKVVRVRWFMVNLE